MVKINILGPSGSGKSTLTQTLGNHFQIPYLHLDQLQFKNDWQIEDRSVFHQKLNEFIAQNTHWLIDGNYNKTRSVRFEQFDWVIFLDLPRHTFFRRVLTRSLKTYGQVRPDMADGCIERFDWSFIKYTWHLPEQQAEIREFLKQLPSEKVIILHSAQELTAFYQKLGLKPKYQKKT